MGASDVQNWSRTALWHVPYISSVTPNPWLQYAMGSVDATVNGIELWPGGIVDYFPRSYNLVGSMSANGEPHSLFSKPNQVVTTFDPISHLNYFVTTSYRYYRLNVFDANDNKAYLSGFFLLVCQLQAPTSIEYSSTNVVLYSGVDQISIAPVLEGLSGCTVTPALPEGIVLNNNTCAITGISSSIQSATTYTITSGSLTGTITITLRACEGGVIKVERVYSSNSAKEGFLLKDASSTFYREDFNQDQQSLTTVTRYLCIASSVITVELSSMNRRWETGSYLNIYKKQGSLETQLLHARYDMTLGLSESYDLLINTFIPIQSQWHYKMNTFSTNWLSEDVSSWSTSTMGSYPSATNQLQFYRSTFTLTQLSGLIVLLRYRYGCLVYLNGKEAFRMNVQGTLSESSYATGTLTELAYQTITIDSSYVTEGLNSIAIAIVASSNSMTEAVFDCSILPASSVSRAFGMVVESAVSDRIDRLFDLDSSTYITYTQCNGTITVDWSPRHEMISTLLVQSSLADRTLQPSSFVVEAKDNNEDTWHVIKQFNGIKWWVIGQQKSIYLGNHKAYTTYRIRNLEGESSCGWWLARLDFLMESVPSSIPQFAYEDSPLSVFHNIEMAEVYPNSAYYTGFSVQPSLPAGILLDPITGVLLGTPTVLSAASSYVVSAVSYLDEVKTTTISLEVIVCYGSKSLITATIFTGFQPDSMRYKLYRGLDTTGVLIDSVDSLVYANSIYYADFCVPHNHYTLVFEGGATGWSDRTGYMLSVDSGSFRFDVGTVAHPSSSSSSYYTTHFSSFLPFQMGFDTWKVWKSFEVPPEEWTSHTLNDKDWRQSKGMEIGKMEDVTVYVRKVIELYGSNDYTVLNVKIKYQGGILGYFNGWLVAKFNLPEIVNSITESVSVHDINDDSFFHIVLHNQGVREGKNVMAFEIHRPKDQSSAVDVVFDATGVLMVNECSVVRDTYMSIDGSLESGALQNLFDLSPSTTAVLPNAVGTHFTFQFLNQVSSQFTYFNILTVSSIPNTAFSLYGESLDEEWLLLEEEVGLGLQPRRPNLIPCTLGLIGFKHFKFELDTVTSVTPEYAEFQLMFCKTTGDVCPGDETYPTVTEGQISPSTCPYGYLGYTYRVCRNGKLGNIQYDKCVLKIPERLQYERTHYDFVLGVYGTTSQPTFEYIVSSFSLDENVQLPEGLRLNLDTGVIDGTPLKEVDLTSYVIYGSNEKGATMVELHISVRKGRCLAETVFPTTTVGETAVYECNSDGFYIGTRKQKCVLGKKDGEWTESSGICIHVGVLIALICVSLIIVAVILFLLRNVFKRRKAVGGSKVATKGTLPAKKQIKKNNNTNVKVLCVCCQKKVQCVAIVSHAK